MPKYKKLVQNMLDQAHKFSFWDFGILKLTIFAAALTIADIIPAVLWLPFWVYLIVWIGGTIYLLRDMKWK